MSIAIISSTLTNQPAYNQMIFDVSSTNAGQTNFNFIADVYAGGVLVSRLAFPKQPSVNTVKMDISPVMKNYITYDLENVYGALWAANTNSQKDYYVQFGESYGATPTIYPNLTRNPTSGSKYAYNSIFDFEQFTAAILADYKIDTYGFLLMNDEITIKAGQDLYLSYYDPNQLITDISITAPGTTPVGPINISPGAGQFIFNIGMSWSRLTAYGLNGFATNGGSYTISVYASGDPDPVWEITVTVESCVDKFEIYRLHWLNQLGGWDSYNFTKNSLLSEDIDRTQFKKVTPLNYTVNDRLKVNYNTLITDKVQCSSDWLTDTESTWLQSLLESPIVLLERTSTMIPIQLTASSYDIKKYLTERTLHQLTIDFEYSYNRYRQSL